jgi:DNA-binding response OmpR family regulator/chromosome segregation ATPase
MAQSLQMAGSAQTPTPALAGPEGPVQPAGDRKRILIVESDGFTRLVLIFMFRLAGFAVDFTSNVMLAEGKLRATPPDALIVELKLPMVSGLELVRKARREPQFGNKPIYLFTAKDQIHRNIQKEVESSVTRIFDKRTTVVEDLLNIVVAEMTGVPIPEPHLSTKTPDKPVLQPSLNTILPGNMDEIIGGVQEECEQWVKSGPPGPRIEDCDKLLNRLRYLLSCAQAAGLRNLARHTRALEAFLNQFRKGRDAIKQEEVGTIVRAVDLLSSLSDGDAKELAQFTVGVIDESAMSAGALSVALLKVGIKPVSFENPKQALTHLSSNPVDVIIVNLGVPEFHGFDSALTNQFPQLSGIPIILVPEPITFNSPDWAEPIAALLNANSRLLAGLIMRVLNELQSPDRRRTRPSSPSPAQEPVAQEETTPNLLESAPGEPNSLPPLKPWGQLLQARTSPEVTSEPANELSEVQPANLNAEEAIKPSNKGTILFVEDDPFVVKVYSKALECAGFRVETAQDGLSAFGLLPQIKPALVVLDLMLPQVDGLEVLQFVRGDSDLKETPVIVLSNTYVGQLATRAGEAGANCGLSKADCTPGKLVREVCELLGQPVPKLESGLEAAGRLSTGTGQTALNEQAPNEVVKIRNLCLSCSRAVNLEKNSVEVSELYRRVHFLSARAALIGFTKIADVSSALEGLLFELMFHQSQPASSTFETIARAVDFVDQLVQRNDIAFAEPRPEPKVLVIDSDPASNVATVTGLQRGRFEVLGIQDPGEGVRRLQADRFDAVTVDINAPGEGGLEVYEQLRQTPQHQTVPVIIFGASKELEGRVTSDANEVIPKDACALEVVLRLIMQTLKPSDQGFAVNTNLQSLAGNRQAARELEGDWLTERNRNSAEAQTASEQFVPMTTTSQDSTVDGSVEANLSSETLQGEQTSETPQAQEETFANLSMDMRTERSTDEPYGAIRQGEAPVSETPDEQILQPAPEAKENENEWLAAAGGVAAEPASAQPGGAENGTDQNQSAAAFESTTSELPRLRMTSQAGQESEGGFFTPQTNQAESEGGFFAPQASQAESEGGFFAPQVGAEAGVSPQSNPESGITEEPVFAASAAAVNSGTGSLLELLRTMQAESAKQRETAAKFAKERETLMNRIFNAENELHRQGSDLEGKDAAIAELQSKLEKFEALPEGTDFAKHVEELRDQLNQRGAELEQAKAEAEKQVAERELVESDLRRQLEEASVAAEQKAAAHQEVQGRCGQLEQELEDLVHAAEEVKDQLVKEKQVNADAFRNTEELKEQLSHRGAELEQAKTEAEKQATEHGLAESDLLRQLEEAGIATEQNTTAQQEAQARCGQLEQELEELRKAREEVANQLAKEQASNAEAAKRMEELKEELSRHVVELELAKTKALKQAAERVLAESDLRRKLEAAGAAAAQQNTISNQHAEERCGQLEKELTELRHTLEEVTSQLAKEKQANVDASARVKELESQLQSGKDQAADLEQGINQRVAALTRVTADLAKERGERHRSEERVTGLNRRLQEMHAESRLLLESQRADQEHIGKLEEQLRERDETLRKQSAELEQLQAECQLAEEQLDKTSDLNADLHKHLSSFDVAHKTLNSTQQDLQSRLDAALNSLQESGSKLEQGNAERERLSTELEETRRELQNHSRKHENLETEHQATVQALGESESKLQQEAAERQRLAAALDMAQRELQNKGRNRETLESDFRATSEELNEIESRLQQETAERQRLAQALESAQRNLRDQTQRAEVELSKAQCALKFEQVERERLQAETARLRHASLDARRGSRMQRNALRKQVQQPVNNLYKIANNLLQLEMNEEQKALAEAILQDVLLVQSTLEEPETPQAEPEEPGTDNKAS